MANTNISAILPSPGVNTSVASVNGQTVSDTGSAFKNFLDNKSTASPTADSRQNVTGADAYARSGKSPAQDIPASVKDPVSQEEADSIKDEISGKIVEKVTKDLDITEEQLNDVMQMLGITVLDLLQPQNLKAVFSQITGTVGTEQLIVNADFMQMYSDITQIAQDYSTQLDVLSQMDIVDENSQVMDISLGDDIDITVDSQVKTVAEDVTVDTESVTDKTDTDTDASNITQQEDSAYEKTVSVTVEEENTPDSSPRHENGMAEQHTEHENAGAGLLQSTNGDIVAQEVFETPFTDTRTQVDTADIIRQIAERVSINNSAEESTIEMQLNPENLGRLYINVSEKNSQITARIAVTNEAVREALETQMVNLRDSLNNAGIKVDAVEVTIASHEFERNLEQNFSDSAAGEDNNQNGQKFGNGTGDEFNGNFAAADAATEKEILAQRIMQDNGNSVDFTA